MSRGVRRGRSKQVRERRCVATGQSKAEAALLRVALDFRGRVTPDVAARLPGRGVWVSADRILIDKAVSRRLFDRAFERAVETPADLPDQFEALLRARLLSALGLARRAGRLDIGTDAVRLALQSAPAPVWRIEASDAAVDGRSKLDRLMKALGVATPVLGCFDAGTLSGVLGVGNAVHAVLLEGPEATAVTVLAGKLAGFIDLDPAKASAHKS